MNAICLRKYLLNNFAQGHTNQPSPCASDNGTVSWILLTQVVSASAYAGFQWTVHLVVYPQLAEVPPSAFVAFERRHQRRISFVVGPLFAALVLSAALLCVRRPPGTPLWGVTTVVALVLVVLASTGLFAVPLHRRLEQGWDWESHRRLTRVDLVRVVAATLNVAVSVVLVLG